MMKQRWNSGNVWLNFIFLFLLKVPFQVYITHIITYTFKGYYKTDSWKYVFRFHFFPPVTFESHNSESHWALGNRKGLHVLFRVTLLKVWKELQSIVSLDSWTKVWKKWWREWNADGDIPRLAKVQRVCVSGVNLGTGCAWGWAMSMCRRWHGA